MTLFVIFAEDGEWSSWQLADGASGQCSTTCGPGKREEVRSCIYLDESCKGETCGGDPTRLVDCNLQVCPGKYLGAKRSDDCIELRGEGAKAAAALRRRASCV